jgi:hypothetical protein
LKSIQVGDCIVFGRRNIAAQLHFQSVTGFSADNEINLDGMNEMNETTQISSFELCNQNKMKKLGSCQEEYPNHCCLERASDRARMQPTELEIHPTDRFLIDLESGVQPSSSFFDRICGFVLPEWAHISNQISSQGNKSINNGEMNLIFLNTKQKF